MLAYPRMKASGWFSASCAVSAVIVSEVMKKAKLVFQQYRLAVLLCCANEFMLGVADNIMSKTRILLALQAYKDHVAMFTCIYFLLLLLQMHNKQDSTNKICLHESSFHLSDN